MKIASYLCLCMKANLRVWTEAFHPALATSAIPVALFGCCKLNEQPLVTV
jgi:hypothetical protein